MGKFVSGLLCVVLLIMSTAWAAEGGGHGGEKKEGEATGPVIEYVGIEPALVVNLQGTRRYLKVEAHMLVEGQENVDRAKTHMPALRHTLILLLSNHDPAVLTQPETREKLRAQAFIEVKAALEKYANSSAGLKDIFFSNFLIQ